MLKLSYIFVWLFVLGVSPQKITYTTGAQTTMALHKASTNIGFRDFDEAWKSIGKADEINPANFRVLLARARFLEGTGVHIRAREQYQRVVQLLQAELALDDPDLSKEELTKHLAQAQHRIKRLERVRKELLAQATKTLLDRRFEEARVLFNEALPYFDDKQQQVVHTNRLVGLTKLKTTSEVAVDLLDACMHVQVMSFTGTLKNTCRGVIGKVWKQVEHEWQDKAEFAFPRCKAHQQSFKWRAAATLGEEEWKEAQLALIGACLPARPDVALLHIYRFEEKFGVCTECPVAMMKQSVLNSASALLISEQFTVACPIYEVIDNHVNKWKNKRPWAERARCKEHAGDTSAFLTALRCLEIDPSSSFCRPILVRAVPALVQELAYSPVPLKQNVAAAAKRCELFHKYNEHDVGDDIVAQVMNKWIELRPDSKQAMFTASVALMKARPSYRSLLEISSILDEADHNYTTFLSSSQELEELQADLIATKEERMKTLKTHIRLERKAREDAYAANATVRDDDIRARSESEEHQLQLEREEAEAEERRQNQDRFQSAPHRLQRNLTQEENLLVGALKQKVQTNRDAAALIYNLGLQLLEPDPLLLVRKAVMCRKNDQVVCAINTFSEVLKVQPGHTEAEEAVREIEDGLLAHLHAGTATVETIKGLQVLSTHRPRNLPLELRTASAMYDLEPREEHVQVLVELGKAYPPAKTKLAQIYIKAANHLLGTDPVQSKARADEALRFQPDLHLALYVRAMALCAVGQVADGAMDLVRAISKAAEEEQEARVQAGGQAEGQAAESAEAGLRYRLELDTLLTDADTVMEAGPAHERWVSPASDQVDFRQMVEASSWQIKWTELDGIYQAVLHAVKEGRLQPMPRDRPQVGTTATVAGFTSAAPLVDRLLGRLGSLLATGGGIDGSLCVEGSVMQQLIEAGSAPAGTQARLDRAMQRLATELDTVDAMLKAGAWNLALERTSTHYSPTAHCPGPDLHTRLTVQRGLAFKGLKRWQQAISMLEEAFMVSERNTTVAKELYDLCLELANNSILTWATNVLEANKELRVEVRLDQKKLTSYFDLYIRAVGYITDPVLTADIHMHTARSFAILQIWGQAQKHIKKCLALVKNHPPCLEVSGEIAHQQTVLAQATIDAVAAKEEL